MQTLVARVEPAIDATQARVSAGQLPGFPVQMAHAIFDGLRRQARAWEPGLCLG